MEEGLIKATQLKGRSNYLCLRRWNYLAHSENPSADEARLLSKTAFGSRIRRMATGPRLTFRGGTHFLGARYLQAKKADVLPCAAAAQPASFAAPGNVPTRLT